MWGHLCRGWDHSLNVEIEPGRYVVQSATSNTFIAFKRSNFQSFRKAIYPNREFLAIQFSFRSIRWRSRLWAAIVHMEWDKLVKISTLPESEVNTASYPDNFGWIIRINNFTLNPSYADPDRSIVDYPDLDWTHHDAYQPEFFHRAARDSSHSSIHIATSQESSKIKRYTKHFNWNR